MSKPDAQGDAIAALRRLLAGTDAWLVGGSVRDRLLGRPTADLDVAIAADTAKTARALARRVGAAVFPLSEAFGSWRVIASDHSWQVDLTPLGASTIEDDLGQRDFTINAIAEPLAGGALVDPFGGRADLEAGRLRMVAPGAFAADPLRTLRLPRIAAELGLEVDVDTGEVARSVAPALAGVAAERIFAELKRIVAGDAALRGLELMLAYGVTQEILPELAELRGVEQSPYHHLDVYDHTIAALAETIALERSGSAILGERAPAVTALLAEPLADELTRGQALRFGALLHDIAKPQTRSVNDAGRISFIGHDALGAEVAREVLGRLRASARMRAHVAALTRHHLRLGFLVHATPLTRRAIYRYLRASEPVEVDVTLLSIADRLATRGARADQSIACHLELAGELVDEGLRWRAGRPAPIVRGDELARHLRLGPGPELGTLLCELEEAAFAGEVSTPDEAMALARDLVANLREADDRS
ncbi:MAG: HDIG domain-containing protein [Actinomycetota bacterium]|nr:HDIG domain-containing protein [Actinomycetota bacterium]